MRGMIGSADGRSCMKIPDAKAAVEKRGKVRKDPSLGAG